MEASSSNPERLSRFWLGPATKPSSDIEISNRSLDTSSVFAVRVVTSARPQLVNGLVNSVRQLAGWGLDSGPAT